MLSEHRRLIEVALKLNCERSNQQIADEVVPGIDRHRIERIRHRMENVGAIPIWRKFSYQSDRSLRAKVTGALLVNHQRGNPEIASQLGCGENTVMRYRHQLELEGVNTDLEEHQGVWGRRSFHLCTPRTINRKGENWRVQ